MIYLGAIAAAFALFRWKQRQSKPAARPIAVGAIHPMPISAKGSFSESRVICSVNGNHARTPWGNAAMAPGTEATIVIAIVHTNTHFRR